MKLLSGFVSTAAVFLTVSSIAVAADISADSRITAVAIYPGSARITRSASIRLDKGPSHILFENILPVIDENSIRVTGEGAMRITIFGAQVQKKYLQEDASAETARITAEIEKTEEELFALKDTETILTDEKQFLDSIRLFSRSQIPEELITKFPAVGDLETILVFLDKKLKDTYARWADMRIQNREIRKKLDRLRKELALISGPQKKLIRTIAVDIESHSAGTAVLHVSYVVRGASWQPMYDARAYMDKNEVELISYALARQKTGEDWNEVDAHISTAKPDINGRMPYVAPCVVRPQQPVRHNALRKEKKFTGLSYQMAAFDEQGILEKDEEEPQVKEASVAYTSPQQKGTSVTYALPQKATVKTDGTEYKLPIGTQILAARFEYSVFPKQSPYAYLGSRVTNARDMQLLAGPVHIFLDGDFAGSSGIETIGPNEEFDLYLGIDEGVKVRREQLEKNVDDVLFAGIASPNIKITIKRKITIENFKSKTITVNIFEPMPVSENDRIKIKIIEPNISPKEKDWKGRKGVYCWKLAVNQKEKIEITYGYSVEYPRDMRIEGFE